MSFIDDNLERIFKQCDGGDEAMTFLAIYSFIEGYYRDLYPNEFKFDKKIYFHSIMDGVKSRHLKTSFPAESTLYETLKKYHGEDDPNAYKNLRTSMDTNRIRHCFGNLRPGSLSVVINQFVEFARYNGFFSERISNLNKSINVEESRKKIPLKPEDDSVLYQDINDLFIKYESCVKNRNIKERLIKEIDDAESQLLSNAEIGKFPKLAENLRDKKAQLSSVDKISETLSCYENYINELAISLIEARSKKNYENQIIHLSEQQRALVKDDIEGLTNKPGHSMYIKGGPGTGKTLVLIAILFKLYSSRKRTKLLTYYPTLNKYISYLFDLYNDQRLLADLNIVPLNEKQLRALSNTGILTFEDYILPKIAGALGIPVNSVRPIKEIKDAMMSVIYGVEPDKRKAARLYDEITTNVWPNLLTEPEYYTDKISHKILVRKQERWEKIKEIIKRIDDNNIISDFYVYYKFGLDKNIDEIALSNYLEDYILIDEAQDLTNAQIYAINKFVDEKGGLILAGDPCQEIRNKRITMGQLDVNIGGGKRYNPELIQNYRSSQLIQDLGNSYKLEPCLHIRKNTKSVEGITAGPPPKVFITDDSETSDYKSTINQIVISAEMCVKELCIPKDNICIVAFTESDLLRVKEKLEERGLDSVLIYRNYSFKKPNNVENPKIKLCTINEIKGIDCAVLLFFISDQSKECNYGGIVPELKANAIYTCITRAMYLLQVFIPRYCVLKDLSVAVLVNKLNPNDEEISRYVEEQNRKERKGIPLHQYFEEYKNETEVEILRKIEIALKTFYERKFGSDENCIVEFSEDSMIAYVYARKKIVADVQDDITEISLADAVLIRPEAKIDDEIEIYIPPETLAIRDEKKSTEEHQPSIKRKSPYEILCEIYNKLENKRTDKFGKITPGAKDGYLNISGCGLSKPTEFGYTKWPELIKDDAEHFDYVIYPYTNGTTGSVFAFRPKIVNGNPESSGKTDEISTLFKGRIEKVDLVNGQIWIRPETFLPNQKCGPKSLIAAWLSANENYRDTLYTLNSIGTRVEYEEIPGRMFRDEDRPYYVAVIKNIMTENKSSQEIDEFDTILSTKNQGYVQGINPRFNCIKIDVSFPRGSIPNASGWIPAYYDDIPKYEKNISYKNKTWSSQAIVEYSVIKDDKAPHGKSAIITNVIVP